MFNLLRSLLQGGTRIPLGIKLVVFVIFLRLVGWGFIDPYFPIFVGSFSDHYAGVGFLVSIMSAVSLITIIPLLRLADKVRTVRLMEDAEVLYFFAMAFYIMAGVFRSIPFLVAGLIFNGLGHPLVTIASESYIRKHDTKGGGVRSFGYYTAMTNFGWILGMVVGAFTIQYYGFNFMFLALLPSIILGLSILMRIPERGIATLLSGFRHFFHRREDFTALWGDIKQLDRKRAFFLFLAFFDGIIAMVSHIFVPLLALSFNLSLKQISLLMAVMYLPLALSFLLSQATQSFRRMNVIATGLFIGGLSFIFLSFVTKTLFIVILASMVSFSLAIIRPVYNGMLSRLTPHRMLGEITGINNLAARLGHVFGPIVCGLIADAYGLNFSFLLIAAFAFALAGVTLFLKGYELVSDKEVVNYIHS